MKQVLIVDDDTLVREYLSKSAYDLFGDSEVFTTSTMTGALSICAHSQPSTILLDLNLPDTTGLDGLIALRALCPISCIIMISGSIPNEKLMEKIREEANGFLTKSNHHLSQLANMISEIEAGEEIFETTRPPFGLISRSYSGLSPIENQASVGASKKSSGRTCLAPNPFPFSVLSETDRKNLQTLCSYLPVPHRSHKILPN